MQRARRFAFVAALAVAGLTALTGCRTNPEVAVYLGQDRYTEAQVTQIYENAYDTLQAAVREQAAQQARALVAGAAWAKALPSGKRRIVPARAPRSARSRSARHSHRHSRRRTAPAVVTKRRSNALTADDKTARPRPHLLLVPPT